ncbi:MAG: hypothetical protein RLZZ502_1018 [Pseudomonadota bacterium]|jgi:probable addiction module antidote protein
MSHNKSKVSELKEFDFAEYLQSDEDIKDYIQMVLAEGDPKELPQALNVIARARGMTDIAQAAGVAREALYRSLAKGASPRYETIVRVISALGLRFLLSKSLISTKNIKWTYPDFCEAEK